jgi:adenylate cyclase
MTQSNTRLLAVIMFPDMVGYTALMRRDEAKAIALRKRHREVLEKTIGTHGGKILQYFGDGTPAIFNSVIQAAKSAVRIQFELQR